MLRVSEQPLFDFCVLIWFEDAYKHWIARCLETGSVATADTEEVCRDMIRELLIDELQFNLDRNNLANLFSAPAPTGIWVRWHVAESERGVVRTWAIKWQGREYEAVALMRLENQ